MKIKFTFLGIFTCFPLLFLQAAPWTFCLIGDTHYNHSNAGAATSVLEAIASHTEAYEFIINAGDITELGTSAEE